MADYEALVKFGHSPARALEICIDAKRGDERAITWISMVKYILARTS